MTPGDVARVLAAAAAVDARTVGAADIAAWHRIIGDLDYGDAIAAVAAHYAEHTDRLMPAHIRRLVAGLIRERKRAAREAKERLAIEAEQAAAGDRGAETDRLLSQLRETLSNPGRDVLRRQEWVEWERKAHRASWAEAEPNPDFRGWTIQ